MTAPPPDLPSVGAPATRALHAAGYVSLGRLAGASRSEIAALHGVGPRALSLLEAALERQGLGFAPAADDEQGRQAGRG